MNYGEVSLENIAHEVSQSFRLKIGSQEIAQEQALVQIGRIFQEVDPRSVLDLGAGIGTISLFLSRLTKNKEISLFLYETNNFCQEQILRNLEGIKFHLIKTTEQLEQLSESLDLIIIDDFIDFYLTKKLLLNSQPQAIFIEGHRRRQRQFVYRALRESKQKFKFYNFRPLPGSHKVGCLFQLNSRHPNPMLAFISINLSLIYSRCKSLQAKIPLLRRLAFRKLLRS